MEPPRHIVVIGAGIAGLTAAFRAKAGGACVTVLEAGDEVGGKLRTRHLHGFVVEEAANGWLRGDGGTDALCVDTNIGGTIVTANANARRRFIVHRGQLRELPANPLKLATSDVLSFTGRVRLAREPFVAAKRGRTDESVADFARRRVGDEALQTLFDPMVTGIYAGDPEKLSVGSAYPRLVELEQTHGSLFRGMVAAQKHGEALDALPEPRALQSLHMGMSTLCEALAAQLDVRRVSPVQRLTKRGAGFVVATEHEVFEADRVIVAAPSYAAAAMLVELDNALAAELHAIAYNAVAVVALGFRRAHASRIGGFGFLAPFKEQRRVLGTLIESNVFANRAPHDYVLMRTIVGGTRRPELARLPDDELLSSVREELQYLTDIRAAPELVHIVRHPRAIPQYEVGHAARLLRIAARLADHPGLLLTGNAYRGVAVNDCIADASQIAARALS